MFGGVLRLLVIAFAVHPIPIRHQTNSSATTRSGVATKLDIIQPIAFFI